MQNKTPLMLDAFLQHRTIGQPYFSPNGDAVVFPVKSANTEQDRYDCDLWLWDGDTVRPLTACGDVKAYGWLDHSTVLFSVGNSARGLAPQPECGRGTHFYRVNRDHAPEHFGFVPFTVDKIAPCGSRVALLTGLEDCEEQAQDCAQAALPQLKIHPADYERLDELPFWKNGRGFCSKKRQMLMLWDPATKKHCRISDPYINVTSVAVSEEHILFAGNQYTVKKDDNSVLYEFCLKEQTAKELLKGQRYGILCVGYRMGEPFFVGTDGRRYGSCENPHIYNVRNGQAELAREMTYNMNIFSERPVCADGDSLVYATSELWYSVIRRDGELQVAFDRGVDSFDAKNGRIVFAGVENSRLPELYIWENGAMRAITHFHDAFFEMVQTSKANLFEVENDGARIGGFYMLPRGWNGVQSFPAICYIHGGPKSFTKSDYLHELQVYAANGYFVYWCNPRGSDGQGNDFADIRGKYGTIDYDDIMKYTDAILKAFPQIDASRLGVTGGSYGGYMTNWIIGHTDRFRTAISRCCISNLTTKVLTTDIGYIHNMEQQACTPWSDFEKMWWHSPLRYADQVKTPTLFIHGDIDYRCWLVEALQMFSALRYHGIPSELMIFHGENHGVGSGKPSRTGKMIYELLHWFNRYLK